MSREIKFRGWYTGPHVNRMLEPNFNGPVNEIFNDPENEGKVIYMQYTGLKDKHGKEIFEGDIVQFDSFRDFTERYEVEYTSYGEWGIGVHRLAMRFKACEVIGNIYEHNHLLEATV